MTPYQPTFNARETGRNVRGFIKQNHALFIDILKPLTAVLLLIMAVELFCALLDQTSFLFTLLYSYVYIALAVDWHRVVILGPLSATRMNLADPKHNELVFWGFSYLITIIIAGVALIGGLVAVIGAYIHPITLVVTLIPLVWLCLWLALRWSFYFPAKAVGAPITMREAWHLSRGYAWKLFAAYMWATWRLALVMIGIFLLPLISVVLIPFLDKQAFVFIFVMGFMLALVPVYLYFMPLCSIIWVNILSNYYLHAKSQELTAA